jgi:hypothetical protein
MKKILQIFCNSCPPKDIFMAKPSLENLNSYLKPVTLYVESSH